MDFTIKGFGWKQESSRLTEVINVDRFSHSNSKDGKEFYMDIHRDEDQVVIFLLTRDGFDVIYDGMSFDGEFAKILFEKLKIN
jgi:hypothetical protein